MLRMLAHTLAVEVPKSEEVLASGVVLSQKDIAALEKGALNTGIVRYIGADLGFDVKVGDGVVFVEGTYWKNDKRVNPCEFQWEGHTLTWVPEREVRLIIDHD